MSTAKTAEEKQPIPNQVFVGGMTQETTVQELTKHFESLKLSPAGAPTFFTTPEGVSKGCALVPFASPEAVTAAIATLTGTKIRDSELTAREDRGPRKRREPNQDASFLYVGNLDPSVTGEELQPLFDAHGEVKACNVIRRRRNVDNSVGWASVQYATEQEAKAAQAALHGKEFKGHALTVEMLRSMPRAPRKARQRRRASENQGEAPEQPTPDPCVVWVGNVPWSTTEDTLRGIFAAHGAVKDVTITRDKRSKESRGWGTVTYENAEDAATAIETLSGTKIEDREINVQPRRGPRRRNQRAPAQEAGDQATTADTDEKQPRRRRNFRRRPRRPRREPAAEQEPVDAPAEEAKTAPKRRARRRRNDSQRNEQNEDAVTVHVAESAEGEEGKQNRRRRRRRKPASEGGEEENAEPRERKETVANPDCHLYVRNVPFKATAEELQAFFAEKAGRVISAAITITKKGVSRGWGTVEMGSPEEAQKALGLDKELFQSRPLVVRIDKRVRGEEE